MEVKRVSDIAKIPLKTAEAVVRFSFEFTRNVSQLASEARSTSRLPRQLARQQFDHDVSVAKQTYELGRSRKDDELGFLGGGWLLKLMKEASNNPYIPEEKEHEIAQFVIDEGLDPYTEPLLDDHDAAEATDILRRYNPVRHIFFLPRRDSDN